MENVCLIRLLRNFGPVSIVGRVCIFVPLSLSSVLHSAYSVVGLAGKQATIPPSPRAKRPVQESSSHSIL